MPPSQETTMFDVRPIVLHSKHWRYDRDYDKIITVCTCYLLAHLPICISLMSWENIFTRYPLIWAQCVYV